MLCLRKIFDTQHLFYYQLHCQNITDEMEMRISFLVSITMSVKQKLPCSKLMSIVQHTLSVSILWTDTEFYRRNFNVSRFYFFFSQLFCSIINPDGRVP